MVWFERGYQSHIICGWLGGVSEGGGGCHHGCHLRAGGMWIGLLGLAGFSKRCLLRVGWLCRFRWVQFGRGGHVWVGSEVAI